LVRYVEKKRYANTTIPIKISPKTTLIIPPDSSCISLLRPSPTRVRPKRLGNIRIKYKNCGSVGDIFITILYQKCCFLQASDDTLPALKSGVFSELL